MKWAISEELIFLPNGKINNAIKKIFLYILTFSGFHRLQKFVEGHHISGRSSPYLVDTPCLGVAYAMDLHDVLL